ncbi:MAG TPA: cyclic nucleotide-binding domain-containing protein [Candidatus Limnocylindrales bacterium]|nr:cyclic nucleotide-binding domain-containing protein [Candidatus Limnocylindrales bacterium]
MSPDAKAQVLGRIKQFASCTEADLRLLATACDEVRVPEGTLIAEQGALCHELVIVVSGLLETCRSGRAARLGPGDTVGWDAMQNRGANAATVRTVSAAVLLVMSHRQFLAATSVDQPAARECIMPAPPAIERRKETATHIR